MTALNEFLKSELYCRDDRKNALRDVTTKAAPLTTEKHRLTVHSRQLRLFAPPKFIQVEA